MKLRAILFLCAALPALADTRFQVRRMTRDDVPAGKGQCDIRLQVDGQVEVTVRGDLVVVKTLSGRDATDDGSECNASLPEKEPAGFHFQDVEHRGEMRLTAEPARRNDFAAMVAIRDSAGGYGRYHFRLSWTIPVASSRGSGGPPPRSDADLSRAPAGSGFSWNNSVSYKGSGRGLATINDSGDMRLGDVNVEIDRGGKLVAWFKSDHGRTLQFSGQVMANENGRWKVDAMSEDRRLRGSMWITIDDRQRVGSVSLEATDGRDRMRLSWDRR